MTPTLDFLNAADKRIRVLLHELRPKLFETHGAIEHKLKDDKSAVTEMDLLVETRLKAALAELDSSVGFSGEETGTDYDQKTFWLVDPIDGTEPFIRGLPFATNMIALIDNGQPVMGVIYNFTMDEYYLAMKGKGATCNGHAIHVSTRPLDRSFVVCGSGFVKRGLGESQRRLQQKIRAFTQNNASGFEMSHVASGAYDARIVWNSVGKPWDFAPGALLIQEAGGRVENIGTGKYDFRDVEFIAANPVIFDDLMKFVVEETSA
jgi:myo-inositol-1(or 4)-monophosphatase